MSASTVSVLMSRRTLDAAPNSCVAAAPRRAGAVSGGLGNRPVEHVADRMFCVVE